MSCLNIRILRRDIVVVIVNLDQASRRHITRVRSHSLCSSHYDYVTHSVGILGLGPWVPGPGGPGPSSGKKYGKKYGKIFMLF